MTIVSGSGDQALGLAIREHFNPGDKLMVSVPVSGNINQSILEQVGNELANRGIEVQSISMSGDSLNVSFTNPPEVTGTSFAWLPLLAVLGIVGVIVMGTWTVKSVVTSIGENIIPLTIVVGVLTMVYLALRKRQRV
jgi:hypothetical protein